MDPDLSLILGIILVCLSVPSMLSALSDGRAPRLGAVLILVGGGLVAWAAVTNPGGYSVSDVPEVFLTVLARFMP